MWIIILKGQFFFFLILQISIPYDELHLLHHVILSLFIVRYPLSMRDPPLTMLVEKFYYIQSLYAVSMYIKFASFASNCLVVC